MLDLGKFSQSYSVTGTDLFKGETEQNIPNSFYLPMHSSQFIRAGYASRGIWSNRVIYLRYLHDF